MQETFCVILTHRHGACLGIVLSSRNRPSLDKYIQEKKNILKVQDNFEFFYEENSFICARVLGKTAENLSNLFQFACRMLNTCPSEMALGKSTMNNEAPTSFPMNIQNFIVGTGPGSFTGLRLGCAFVNGIHLASPATKLFSVSTKLVNDLSQELRLCGQKFSEVTHCACARSIVTSSLVCPTSTRHDSFRATHTCTSCSSEKFLPTQPSKNSDALNEFIQQLGPYNPNDHSSGYVTFFDLFDALHQVFENNVVICPTLLPNYAKEPTPVLNLRKV